MIASTTIRKFDALALAVAVVATAVVGLNMGATGAVAEDNREHTSTARHNVYGKQQKRYVSLGLHYSTSSHSVSFSTHTFASAVAVALSTS